MKIYGNIHTIQQQKDIYQANVPAPKENFNIVQTPLNKNNIMQNIYGVHPNFNKNVIQINKNQAQQNANILNSGHPPNFAIPQPNINKQQINPIPKLIAVPKIVNNIIPNQQLNKNNKNIFLYGNNNIINQGYNPAVILPQNHIQTINNNQLPIENHPIQIINPIIKIYNQNMGVESKNEIILNKKDEVSTGHKQIDINIAMKAIKSICKLTILYNNSYYYGTGFFMKISDSLKYLVTNYHVLNPQLANNNIKIEFYNKKEITLNLNGHEIIYMKKPKDITAIKLKESDIIYKDLEFLNYDSNYQNNGYIIYSNIDVFSGNDSKFASGKIIKINGYEFDHNIDTYNGSSGSPIILNNNNINLIQVIGIHKNGDQIKGINGGTFIGELINEINKNSFNKKIFFEKNEINNIQTKIENMNINRNIINTQNVNNIKPNLDVIIGKLLSVVRYKPGKLVNLSEEEIKFVIDKSLFIIKSESVLREIKAPINVVGDIHGQYYDLLRIFENIGYPDKYNYLFLGNYIDFGKQSTEVICLLLCYKIKYPNKITLLRGNHESSPINRINGFYDECKRRYSIRLWKSFSELFNYLPFAAVIDEKIFCVHGGLSPDLNKIEDIKKISRPTEIPDSGLLCDLLFSDPDIEVIEYDENDKGISVVFGEKIVKDFLKNNDLDLIVRGNQVVDDGYEFFAQRGLITVFSAPNFRAEYDNSSGILIIDENLNCSMKVLRPVENLLH